MATNKPKRKQNKRNKYAFLHKIDIRDTTAIRELSIRGLRQMASINDIQLSRTCSTKQDILYSIHTYVEKLHGKDYNLSYTIKPPVSGEKIDKINERTERNVSNNNINWEEAKKLCQMLCTNTEIKGFFSVGLETLNIKCKAEFDMEWQEFYEIHSANGRIALRRAQLKLALDKDKPNVSMLMHLGKTVLGQVESKEGKSDGKIHEGVLTLENLVAYCTGENSPFTDILKDNATLDKTYQEALADSTDEITKSNYQAYKQMKAKGDASAGDLLNSVSI